MSHYPIVSVITATYNKFDGFEKTIKSVLKQDYPNIEYIICDDGSNEFPLNRINLFCDENRRENVVDIKFLLSQHNRGTVKNLNNAYKKAKGKYILNLSCGDVFYSTNTITNIVNKFIETNGNVIVTSRLAYCNNFTPLYLMPHFKERNIILKLTTPFLQYRAFITGRFYDMASGSAMYFSSDIIKMYNYFDEKYDLWEDGPFLEKYLWKNKLTFAYEIISIWYQVGGVSTIGIHNTSTRFKNDVLRFKATDCMNHLKDFNWFDRIIIKFNLKKMYTNNYLSLILLMICNPFASFSHLIYVFKRKFNLFRDKKYVSSLSFDN